MYEREELLWQDPEEAQEVAASAAALTAVADLAVVAEAASAVVLIAVADLVAVITDTTVITIITDITVCPSSLVSEDLIMDTDMAEVVLEVCSV